MQNWIKAILAFSTRVGAPKPIVFWSRTRPSTSSVSSIVPLRKQNNWILRSIENIFVSYPSFLTTRISRKSTLVSTTGLITLSTAWTAIGARRCVCWETTFEFNDVDALRSNDSLSLSSVGMLILRRISVALSAAFSNESAIVVGCKPENSKFEINSIEFHFVYL